MKFDHTSRVAAAVVVLPCCAKPHPMKAAIRQFLRQARGIKQTGLTTTLKTSILFALMLLTKMDVNVAFDGACQTSFCVPSCSFLFRENSITGYFKVPNDSTCIFVNCPLGTSKLKWVSPFTCWAFKLILKAFGYLPSMLNGIFLFSKFFYVQYNGCFTVRLSDTLE